MSKSRADNVLEKIKKEKITVKSRLSVIMQRLGFDGLILGFFGVLALVAGIILVWLFANRDLLSDYGSYGLLSFVQSFPYVPAIVFAGIFFLLLFFLRRFDFSYKKPFAAVTGLLLALIIGIAWIASLHPAGKSVFSQSGRLLRITKNRGANFVAGTVLEVGADYLTLEYADGEKETVYLTEETHYRFGTPEAGDQVRSVGEWDGDKFEAVGVRVFDEEAPRGSGAGYKRRLITSPSATIVPVTPTGTAIDTNTPNGQRRMLNRE